MTGVKEVSLLETAQDSKALVPSPSSDLVLMFERLAKDPAVDVEKLERLIAMQERILRHNAEADFNESFARMLPEIPTIAERAKTDKTKYAPLEDIVEVVRPILSRFGFSMSFRTEWPEHGIRVVGILTHTSGHSRTSEFVAEADKSGSKNAIQALGSTVTYGKRYTLRDLLCIVTRDEDDDASRSRGKDTPPDPDGFDVFLDTLASAAMHGTPALMGEFNKASLALRTHLTKQYNAKWESFKNVALEASKRKGAK